MLALKKWLRKPKRSDSRLLSQFYYSNDELIRITNELESIDNRSDPERCAALISELKQSQEKSIGLIEHIKEVALPDLKSERDFRLKFPDEVIQENLAGQLWFGAECLTAGSTIVNREQESLEMKPLAKKVVRSLYKLRTLLCNQALKNPSVYSTSIRNALIEFDTVFAEFEFAYVSILSNVRSAVEYERLQNVAVLFCETVYRAIEKGYLKQDIIDDYDPGLMFTIPRLAIICGLIVYPEGPLDVTKSPDDLPVMFKPFHKLLRKIKDLLLTLSEAEMTVLEKSLCSQQSFDEVLLEAEHIINSSNEYGYKSRSSRINRRYASLTGAIFPGLYPNKVWNSDGLILNDADRSNLNYLEANIPCVDSQMPNQHMDDESQPNPNSVGLTVIAEVHFDDTRSSNESCNTDGQHFRELREESLPQYNAAPETQEISTIEQLPDYTRDPPPPYAPPSTLNETPSSSTSSVSIENRLGIAHFQDSSSDTETEGMIPQSYKLRELRSRFCSTKQLIHTLFVCISEVADQLQSNYANDLRLTLKCVFDVTTSDSPPSDARDDFTKGWLTNKQHIVFKHHDEPPPWIADEECSSCSTCNAFFNLIRRRHHCRLCGKIFCSSCASNFVPLPRYGLLSPVRVCTACIECALDRFA